MRNTRVFRPHGLAAAWIASIAFAVPSIVASQEDAAARALLDEAAETIDAYERVEAGEADAADTPASEVLGGAGMVVDSYLREHPDDVRALILFARLDRVIDLTGLAAITGGELPDAPGDSHPAIAALNHALRLEPDNAEAHYWLARIYGTTVPKFVDDVYVPGPVDLEKAIEHASRATELAPAERRYREAAAIYLALALRFEDAIEMLRSVDDGEHLVRRILLDLAAVPLPPEARYLPIESAASAETMAERGRFASYANLRVRNYVAPGPASLFVARLRQLWPDFELYEASREKGDEGGEVITSAQFLDVRGAAARPIAVREIERLNRERRELADGILVTVLEFVDPSETVRANFGVTERGGFTLLSLANMRITGREPVAITPFGERLLGRWDVERWRYGSGRTTQSYTGMLGVTAQLSATEFEGVLVARQGGQWARQQTRILVDGDRLELRGRVIASNEGWSADTLSLRLDGNRLSGTSIDATGGGGEIIFVRR